jgi:hypothetical protein
VPVPDAWKSVVATSTIDVLPLVRDTTRQYFPGWCAYTYEHTQAPELEVISGGVNHKTPQAGAIWRQGNLLHFGFEQSPAEMNDAGRALLVNAIAYIARFTDDRPIVRTPSTFKQGARLVDRDVIRRRIERTVGDIDTLKYFMTAATFQEMKDQKGAEISDWFRRVRDYLHADAKGLLLVDVEAQSFGVPPATPAFLETAIADLSKRDRQSTARKLLNRYVPDGPGREAPPEAWRVWWSQNKPYLFFSDTGGFRWYVDPLARARRIPTSELRGPARATLPASAQAG